MAVQSFEYYDKALSGFPRTWTSVPERRLVYDLAKDVGWPILEIGTALGRNVALIASIFRDRGMATRAYGIDVFDIVPDKLNIWSQKHTPAGVPYEWKGDPLTHVRRTMQQLDCVANAVIIKADSTSIPPIWGIGLSVLIVDGCHERQYVHKDLVGFIPHVKPGGYILAHDYTEVAKPGQDVRIVVDELLEKNPRIKLERTVGRYAVLKKV